MTAEDYTRALSAQIAQMVSAITGESEPQVTYILVKAADGSQKPLIVTKTEPEIRGVVVVSRGGSDPKMREKIVEAVKTALDLSSTQVCVVGYSEYTYGNE